MSIYQRDSVTGLCKYCNRALESFHYAFTGTCLVTESERVKQLRFELAALARGVGDSYSSYSPSDFLRTKAYYEERIAAQQDMDDSNRALGRVVLDAAKEYKA